MDQFSSMDIVPHLWKPAVTTIAFKRTCFKVTTLTWEITCPTKRAPLMQALKEIKKGVEKKEDKKSWEFGLVGLKWNKKPLSIFFCHCQKHFHWRKMKLMNWLWSWKVPASLSSMNFKHIRDLQHSEGDCQHKASFWTPPPSCSPSSSQYTLPYSSFAVSTTNIFLTETDREPGNSTFHLVPCWCVVSTMVYSCSSSASLARDVLYQQIIDTESSTEMWRDLINTTWVSWVTSGRGFMFCASPTETYE